MNSVQSISLFLGGWGGNHLLTKAQEARWPLGQSDWNLVVSVVSWDQHRLAECLALLLYLHIRPLERSSFEVSPSCLGKQGIYRRSVRASDGYSGGHSSVAWD